MNTFKQWLNSEYHRCQKMERSLVDLQGTAYLEGRQRALGECLMKLDAEEK